jgi:predicted PurR-regulated permease PerM
LVYIIFTLFVIFTVIYVIIFFIHRKVRKTNTKIKITYNELQNFNQNISFNNIKIYAKNNKQVDKFISIVSKEKEELNT